VIAEASLLLHEADAAACPSVLETLSRFGAPAIAFALRGGTRIVLLRAEQRYDDASASLKRMRVDVDSWPAPPAGLFVVEERTVYLRSRSPMTVAHEFGHALDCALGGGVYLSSGDPQLRALFSAAKAFVTPYAATGTDEYFAECLRAYVEANDPASFWPRATRTRLRRIDPQMYEYVSKLFANGFEISCMTIGEPACLQ
jgi:hypothetical protein